MDSRELHKTASGKTKAPPEVLQAIYATSPPGSKSKNLEEAMKRSERTSSRTCDTSAQTGTGKQ